MKKFEGEMFVGYTWDFGDEVLQLQWAEFQPCVGATPLQPNGKPDWDVREFATALEDAAKMTLTLSLTQGKGYKKGPSTRLFCRVRCPKTRYERFEKFAWQGTGTIQIKCVVGRGDVRDTVLVDVLELGSEGKLEAGSNQVTLTLDPLDEVAAGKSLQPRWSTDDFRDAGAPHALVLVRRTLGGLPQILVNEGVQDLRALMEAPAKRGAIARARDLVADSIVNEAWIQLTRMALKDVFTVSAGRVQCEAEELMKQWQGSVLRTMAGVCFDDETREGIEALAESLLVGGEDSELCARFVSSGKGGGVGQRVTGLVRELSGAKGEEDEA